MTKFDRRLQEIEAVHSAKKSSDSAGATTVQPSVEDVLDIQYDIDGGKEARSRTATTVEHAGREDRWAHFYLFSEPSEATVGASRSMGRGGGTARGWGGKKGGAYNDQVEQVDGINRRNRPTEVTDGASQLIGRGGNKARWRSRGHDKSCRNTD